MVAWSFISSSGLPNARQLTTASRAKPPRLQAPGAWAAPGQHSQSVRPGSESDRVGVRPGRSPTQSDSEPRLESDFPPRIESDPQSSAADPKPTSTQGVSPTGSDSDRVGVRPGRHPTRSESDSDQGRIPTQGRSPTQSDFVRLRPCWEIRQSVRLRHRPNFQKLQRCTFGGREMPHSGKSDFTKCAFS
eukprot:gene18470-biopygen11460